MRILGIVCLLAAAGAAHAQTPDVVPAAAGADRAEATERVVLPPDADRGVDQTPWLERGTYLTQAGVVAPLPSTDPADAPSDVGGVPGMKLH